MSNELNEEAKNILKNKRVSMQLFMTTNMTLYLYNEIVSPERQLTEYEWVILRKVFIG